MNFRTIIVVCLGLILSVANVYGKADLPAEYGEALELIHSYTGAGSELERAASLIESLKKTHPKSGLSETLAAEFLSSWQLDQEGEPVTVRSRVIHLAEEAIRLDPKLAQPHVAKARALLRASFYGEAEREIDAALAIDPTLSGAIFARAEVLRRTGRLAEAESWYVKFIDSTSSASRKANGYGWIAQMYSDAAYRNDDGNQKSHLAKARSAHEHGLQLDPKAAWRNVNFAVFLNGDAADFDAAERYALRALEQMEFPLARWHLAAARYQRLWQNLSQFDQRQLNDKLAEVAMSSKVSLDDLIKNYELGPLVQFRLMQLKRRSAGTGGAGA